MASILVSSSTARGARPALGGALLRPKTLPCGPPRVPGVATSPQLRGRGFSCPPSSARRVACGANTESLDDYDHGDFLIETQHAILRVLTARAVQKVLIRLHRRSTPTYDWLSSFTKVVPPIGGDEFLMQLMKSRAVTHIDGITKLSTTIHPAALAQEVIAVREFLSGDVTKGLPEFAKASNLNVLKRHLEQSHYTLSVTNQKLDKQRKNDDKLGKQSKSEKSSA